MFRFVLCVFVVWFPSCHQGESEIKHVTAVWIVFVGCFLTLRLTDESQINVCLVLIFWLLIIADILCFASLPPTGIFLFPLVQFSTLYKVICQFLDVLNRTFN